MNKPLVTIVTPSFNRAHTLHRVFESLKKQTFQDFEWIIINDGSTDNTDDVVKQFIENAKFKIRYFKQTNQHKFLSLFRGIELAEGTYLSPLDSDDVILPDALDTLVNTWESLPKDNDVVFVLGLCQEVNGTITGDEFPEKPYISSIFDMRYRHKIKGDKWGMGKTEIYRKMKLDLEKLRGKGFIPESVYQYQFDNFGLHYCINMPLHVYMHDRGDGVSLSNQFYSDKNAFGLAENYKTFVNTYHKKLLSYPKPMLRNLAGYLIYSIKDQRSYSQVIKEINPFWAKTICTLSYFFLKNINLERLHSTKNKV